MWEPAGEQIGDPITHQSKDPLINLTFRLAKNSACVSEPEASPESYCEVVVALPMISYIMQAAMVQLQGFNIYGSILDRWNYTERAATATRQIRSRLEQQFAMAHGQFATKNMSTPVFWHCTGCASDHPWSACFRNIYEWFHRVNHCTLPSMCGQSIIRWVSSSLTVQWPLFPMAWCLPASGNCTFLRSWFVMLRGGVLSVFCLPKIWAYLYELKTLMCEDAETWPAQYLDKKKSTTASQIL